MSLTPLLICIALQTPVDRAVLATKLGVKFPLSPRHVIDGPIRELSWSEDGAMLMIRRVNETVSPDLAFRRAFVSPSVDDPDAKEEIWIYNAESRKLVRVASLPPLVASIGEVRWMAKSRTLIATVYRSPEKDEKDEFGFPREFYVIPSSGQAKCLFTVRGKGELSVVVSESVPIGAVMVRQDDRSLNLSFFESSGRVLETQTLPETTTGFAFIPKTSAVIAVEALPGVPPRTRHWRCEVGKPRSIAQPLAELAEPAPAEIYGVAAPGKISFGNESAPGTVGLLVNRAAERAEDAYAILGLGVSDVSVNENGTRVAYVLHGSLFVRPLLTMTPEEFTKRKQLAERERLMNTARQVGFGLAIFSADNDGEYPAAGSDWKKQILPYLKSASLTAQFRYQFVGGKLDPAKAAQTVLGSISGGGGSAVVYGDGRVEWKDGS